MQVRQGIKRVYNFFRYLSLRCDPPLACSLHGRCWRHSRWAQGGKQ